MEEQDYGQLSDKYSDESDVEVQEQVKKDTVHVQNSVFEDVLHPDEIDVHNESIGELRSVDITQNDDVRNYDEIEDIIDTQTTRRDFDLRPTRKRNYSKMHLLQDALIVVNGDGEKQPVCKHLIGIITIQTLPKLALRRTIN